MKRYGHKEMRVPVTLDEAYKTLGVKFEQVAAAIGCDVRTLKRWRDGGEYDPNGTYEGWGDRAIECINEALEARSDELHGRFVDHLRKLELDFKTNQINLGEPERVGSLEDDELDFYHDLYVDGWNLEAAWSFAYQNIAFGKVPIAFGRRMQLEARAREMIGSMDDTALARFVGPKPAKGTPRSHAK